MTSRESQAVGRLFAEVVESLPYYNERAKKAEIEKHHAAQLVQAVEDDPSSVMIVKSGAEIAGFCVSRLDDETLWLSWFGVGAAYRSLGLANQMLQALEARAADKGCHKIWCDSRTTNNISASVLRRNGYRQLCALEDHWYRQDFILWEKFVG